MCDWINRSRFLLENNLGEMSECLCGFKDIYSFSLCIPPEGTALSACYIIQEDWPITKPAINTARMRPLPVWMCSVSNVQQNHMGTSCMRLLQLAARFNWSLQRIVFTLMGMIAFP